MCVLPFGCKKKLLLLLLFQFFLVWLFLFMFSFFVFVFQNFFSFGCLLVVSWLSENFFVFWFSLFLFFFFFSSSSYNRKFNFRGGRVPFVNSWVNYEKSIGCLCKRMNSTNWTNNRSYVNSKLFAWYNTIRLG